MPDTEPFSPPASVYQKLKDAVVASFGPRRNVECSSGHGRVDGEIGKVFCFAKVDGRSLVPFDDERLMKLTAGTYKTFQSETAIIVGRIDGIDYELRVDCRDPMAACSYRPVAKP